MRVTCFSKTALNRQAAKGHPSSSGEHKSRFPNGTGVFTRIRPTINQTRQGSPVSNTIYPISKHRRAILSVVFVPRLSCLPSPRVLHYQVILVLGSTRQLEDRPSPIDFPSSGPSLSRQLTQRMRTVLNCLPSLQLSPPPSIRGSCYLSRTRNPRMARVIFT